MKNRIKDNSNKIIILTLSLTILLHFAFRETLSSNAKRYISNEITSRKRLSSLIGKVF